MTKGAAAQNTAGGTPDEHDSDASLSYVAHSGLKSEQGKPLPKNKYAWDMDIEFELDKDELSAVERAAQREQEQREHAGALKLAQCESLAGSSLADGDGIVALPRERDSETSPSVQTQKDERDNKKSKARKLVEKKYGDSGLSAIDLATTHKEESKYHLDGWRYAPTNKEVERWQKQWEKAQKAKDPRERIAERGPSPRDVIRRANASQQLSQEERKRRRAEDRAKYEALKRDLVLTTSGIAGAGIIISYAIGGADTGASYAIGSLGALVYLRLLGRKVDSKAPNDGSSEDNQDGGAAAPTLLVPAILFMLYNRWNVLAAPQVEHYAGLLPMLLGFFSYKPTTLLTAYKDLTDDDGEMARRAQSRAEEEADATVNTGSEEVQSV